MSVRQFDAKMPGEQRTLTFGFAPDLPAGVTVASVDAITVSTYRGNDPDPSALFVGSPALVGADVLQMVSGGLATADYLFVAWVILSDTQRIGLPALLPVRDLV